MPEEPSRSVHVDLGVVCSRSRVVGWDSASQTVPQGPATPNPWTLPALQSPIPLLILGSLSEDDGLDALPVHGIAGGLEHLEAANGDGLVEVLHCGNLLAVSDVAVVVREGDAVGGLGGVPLVRLGNLDCLREGELVEVRARGLDGRRLLLFLLPAECASRMCSAPSSASE